MSPCAQIHLARQNHILAERGIVVERYCFETFAVYYWLKYVKELQEFY